MESFNNNFSSEKRPFRAAPHRPFSKMNSKGKRPFNRGHDKQKGFVTAFVQGKGQNAALQYLADNKMPVSIFLTAGVKFEGVISSHDAFTISITDSNGIEQMIYKDKISTISTKKSESHSENRPHHGFRKSSENSHYSERTTESL